MESLEDEVNRKVSKLVNEVWSNIDEWTSRHEQAHEMLSHLAEDDRASQVTLCNFGAVLSNQGRHSQAVEVLERLVASEPDFREAYFNLAVALMNTNTVGRGKARDFFKMATEFPSGTHVIEAYVDLQGY